MLQTGTCSDADCRQAGYGPLIGCQDDRQEIAKCICESASQCTSGDYQCNDSSTLATCVGGSWQPEDCTTACINANYSYSTGCRYDPNKGHDVCFCGK